MSIYQEIWMWNYLFGLFLICMALPYAVACPPTDHLITKIYASSWVACLVIFIGFPLFNLIQ